MVLVTPQPRSQRVLRRAWRSAERLGAQLDALWVHRADIALSPEEQVALAALRRLAVVLGTHFIEEEGEDLVSVVRRVVAARGSTYLFLGTPTQGRLSEIVRGSLLSRLVRELPGVDVRVVANRAERGKLEP
jgi:two-component system sensor histidine kinase KdpD